MKGSNNGESLNRRRYAPTATAINTRTAKWNMFLMASYLIVAENRNNRSAFCVVTLAISSNDTPLISASVSAM